MTVLTIAKIQTRLKEIESVKDDDEKAHLWEKELWADALRYIARHAHEPHIQDVAVETLKTFDIEFYRWYA